MKFLIIFGPSGVGKGTIINHLKSKYPSVFQLSVSYTTRNPRHKQTNGKDYFFISKQQFMRKVNNNEMLEHKQVFNNLYGTQKQHINEILKRNKIPILDVDIQGMMDIRKSLQMQKEFQKQSSIIVQSSCQIQREKGHNQQVQKQSQMSNLHNRNFQSLSLCILPPSFKLLKERLKGRKSESQTVVNQRLEENKLQIQKMLKLQQQIFDNLFFVTNYQYQLTVYGIEQWLLNQHESFRTIHNSMSNKGTCFRDENIL